MKSVSKIIVILVLLIIGLGKTYSLSENSVNILILNSYNSENVWTKSQQNGIVDTLNENEVKYNLYIENMDTKRFNEEDDLKQIFNYLYNKYINKKIDYIIATDDSAFNFLNSNKSEIFDDAKVVFSGLNYLHSMDRSEFTGVYEKLDIKTNVDLALKLFPNTKNVYLIGEDQVTTNSIALETYEYLENNKNVNVKIVLSKSIEVLRSSMENAGDDSIVLFTIFNMDEKGNTFSYKDGFLEVMNGIKLPTFSFWSFYDGLPMIGGYVSDGYISGKMASDMLIRILNGEDIESIEVVESKKIYKLNYEELKKFGIENVKLDKNIEYINRPVSIFEKNKKMIITFFLIITLLSIIILLLYRNNIYAKENVEILTENRKIQDEVNFNLEKEVALRIKDYEDLNEELQKTLIASNDSNLKLKNANNLLSSYLRKLKETQDKLIESEKMASLGGLVAGISHEINTPIGIAVTGNSFMEKLLRELNEKYHEEHIKKSDLNEFLSSSIEINMSIQHSLEHAADLINKFKRVAVDQSSNLKRKFELKEYIEEIMLNLNYELKKRTINLEYSWDSQVYYFGDPSMFFQILTNLTNNSLLHAFDSAKSASIKITLASKKEYIEIIYSDNGNGIKDNIKNKIFDPFFTTKRGKGGSGLGLNIIYNIVNQNLDGSIVCESKEGEGSKFIIRFPHNIKESEVENG